MPRRHVNPPPLLAASPAKIAAMFDIRPDDLAKAIKEKRLKVFQIGARRRIMLEDAKAWLRTWSEAQPYRPRQPKQLEEVSKCPK
jgi:hypothetical protein